MFVFISVLLEIKYLVSTFSNVINFTMESLVNTDYIDFRFNLTGPNSELVTNYSICGWKFNRADYRYNVFIADVQLNRLTFAKYTKYGRYHLINRCVIGQYRTFDFNKTFVIHSNDFHLQ